MTKLHIPRFVQVNVDIQNDFTPGGNLGVIDGDQVVPPLNNIAQEVRKTPGGKVIHTRDWHPRETDHFVTYGGVWPEHCIADTYGAAFDSQLEIDPLYDTILSKGTEVNEDAYSGFQAHGERGESLPEFLRPRSRREKVYVIIGGLATDYCVKATVLDALGFKRTLPRPSQLEVYAVSDAMKAVNIKPTDGDEAIQTMLDAGAAFLTCGEVIDLIRHKIEAAYGGA